jgi:hypothetical protein
MWHVWKRKLNMCGIVIGRPERKRALERSRRRWQDNVKKILMGIR